MKVSVKNVILKLGNLSFYFYFEHLRKKKKLQLYVIASYKNNTDADTYTVRRKREWLT